MTTCARGHGREIPAYDIDAATLVLLTTGWIAQTPRQRKQTASRGGTRWRREAKCAANGSQNGSGARPRGNQPYTNPGGFNESAYDETGT